MTIRWGILGCGAVTEVKSGPGFQRADGSELVAVMRRNAKLAEDYARRHSVPKWYSRAEDLISDPQVDIVSIATPPSSHCELALQVCAAGKPALVEKPMAMNGEECQRMIDAFAAAGLPLFVAYYRRALPRFLKVKQLVESGAIGEARSVFVRLLRKRGKFDPDNLPWRVVPEIAGGGYFVDVGSHTLDLVDYLTGPIADVKGTAANQGHFYPAEDSAVLSFQCQSGGVGAGIWQFDTSENLDQFEIHGVKGALKFATFEDMPIRLIVDGQEESFAIENPPHIQQPLIQTIVNQLTGGPPCPSTGVSGARTTRVIDTVLAEFRKPEV